MDHLASSLFTNISSVFDDDSYLSGFLVNGISSEVRGCNSILATDVLGPLAWVTPNAYKYLSIQIKEYLRKNTEGDEWKLIVSKLIGNKIKESCQKVKDLTVMGESFSVFDNPNDFSWKIGTPKLQFARILLWSKEELLSPIGESIIAIHQAFNVPVFYLEVDKTDTLRDNDFIIFEKQNGTISGYYNSRINNFKPEILQKGSIPQVGNCKKIFENLLNKEDLQLAIDARYILKHKSKKQ